MDNFSISINFLNFSDKNFVSIFSTPFLLIDLNLADLEGGLTSISLRVGVTALLLINSKYNSSHLFTGKYLETDSLVQMLLKKKHL